FVPAIFFFFGLLDDDLILVLTPMHSPRHKAFQLSFILGICWAILSLVLILPHIRKSACTFFVAGAKNVSKANNSEEEG
ncbi:MAG: hypothetical protein AAGJ35_03745, partial [Myxococcota bacterium]